MDKKLLRLSQEQINQIPPLSLNEMNEELINAYTLNQFSFNKDDLPCIILLLPDDQTPTGHYIALAQSLDKRILYYFDSYGYNPLKLWETHPQMIGEKQDIDKWGEFLKQYDKTIYQDEKLQNDNSNLCGYYCLTYIYEFLNRNGYDPELFAKVLNDIKKKFNLDTYDNALLVYYLSCVINFKEMFKQLKKKEDVNV